MVALLTRMAAWTLTRWEPRYVSYVLTYYLSCFPNLLGGNHIEMPGMFHFDITFIIWILWNDGHSVLGLPTDIFCLTDAHCQTLFNSKVVSRLLNETSFDLVIIDYIANECSIALAA